MTDQTTPNVQQGDPPPAPVPAERCGCGHTKRDHSDRRDHKPSRIVPRRPWCHGCSVPCDYAPAPTALRDLYAAAIERELTRYARTDIDPGTGSDVGDQVAIALAVRDREVERLQQRLTLADEVHQENVATIERVRAAAYGLADGTDAGFRAALAILAALDPQEASAGHLYLSTGCLHDRHDYCQSMTGLAGAKRPAECKFCQAACTCRCHRTTA